MSPRSTLLVLPVLVLAVTTPSPLRANLPLPAGLADAAGRTGFFTMIRGHLEAIDLATGDTLWSSDRAQRALLIVGDRLFALSKSGGKVRILGLDLLAKGGVTMTSDPLPLPAWSALRDEPGQSFRWQARVVPEYLEVHWEARAWYAGRAKATAQSEAAARKHASGLLRVHLLTGEVQASPAEFPQTPPALPPATLRGSIRWSAAIEQWLFAVVVDQTSTGQSASLRSWLLKTGQELPARPILSGRRLQVVPGLSERYLFVREALPSPAEATADPVRWQVWSLERGALIGRVPYEPGTLPGTVVGNRVLFVKSEPFGARLNEPHTQPRVLRAVDLTTGKIAWERPIEGKPVAPPTP